MEPDRGSSGEAAASLLQSKPKGGMHALAGIMRESLEADICLIALGDPQSSEANLYHACSLWMSTRSAGAQSRFGARLSVRSRDGALLFNDEPASACRRSGIRDLRASSGAIGSRQALADLATLLGVSSLLSVPLDPAEAVVGRIYIGSRERRHTSRDLLRLAELAKHACSLIRELSLFDHLTAQVACQQRRRISRDLHDSAIQPYIGLKLGLEAMRRRLGTSRELAKDLDELITIAADGIGELRQYIGKLRNAESQRQVASLLSAVRLQAKKFTELYGVEAEVVADRDIPISGPLHDEIIQIVREGLSNIRRHTCAERATISLREAHGRLLVELTNDRTPKGRKHSFFPRSIGERAKDLGGRVRVQRSGHHTVVAVDLPLRAVSE